MQLRAINIGVSGGGWKSRLKGVGGCSNGLTVGEIALVVFYYSIIPVIWTSFRTRFFALASRAMPFLALFLVAIMIKIELEEER